MPPPRPGGKNASARSRPNSAGPPTGARPGADPRPASATLAGYDAPGPPGGGGGGGALLSPQTHVRPAGAACVVCRLEPLIFRECPVASCAARYCASGCLQSWYEYSKPSRARPFEAPVLASEPDYLTVSLPPTEDSEDGDGTAAEDVELAITRIAGGHTIVDDASKGASGEHQEKRRWSIASVDGWVLGMPGPGPDWQPAQGVKLSLEEVGCCQICRTPLAIPEYICNSASRPRSASHRSSGSTQRPRVRTSDADTQTEVTLMDADTQTEVTLMDAEMQTEVTLMDAGVQASPPPGAAAARARAEIAGSAVAVLAEPAEVGSGGGAANIVLTACPEVARRCLRSALTAIARLAVGADEKATTSSCSRALLLQEAISAVTEAQPGAAEACVTAPAMNAGDLGGRRVLGHARRAAVPRFVTPTSPSPKDGDINGESGGGCSTEAPELCFEAGASKELAGGALAALRCAEQGGTMCDAGREGSMAVPPGVAGVGMDEADVADSLLLRAKCRGEDGEGGASGEDTLLRDAVVNIAALLCTDRGEELSNMPVLSALGAVSRLLAPTPQDASLYWRQMSADEGPWPWATAQQTPTTPAEKVPHPHGWPLVRAALGALRRLASQASVDEGGGVASLLCDALRSLARLALFVDAEDERVAEAMRAVTEKAPLAPPPPPPPPPPPLGAGGALCSGGQEAGGLTGGGDLGTGGTSSGLAGSPAGGGGVGAGGLSSGFMASGPAGGPGGGVGFGADRLGAGGLGSGDAGFMGSGLAGGTAGGGGVGAGGLSSGCMFSGQSGSPGGGVGFGADRFGAGGLGSGDAGVKSAEVPIVNATSAQNAMQDLFKKPKKKR